MSKRFLKYETENNDPRITNDGSIKSEKKILLLELIPCVKPYSGELEDGCNCFYQDDTMREIQNLELKDVLGWEDALLDNMKPSDHICMETIYTPYDIEYVAWAQSDMPGAIIHRDDEGAIHTFKAAIYDCEYGDYVQMTISRSYDSMKNFVVSVKAPYAPLKGFKIYKITQE